MFKYLQAKILHVASSRVGVTFSTSARKSKIGYYTSWSFRNTSLIKQANYKFKCGQFYFDRSYSDWSVGKGTSSIYFSFFTSFTNIHRSTRIGDRTVVLQKNWTKRNLGGKRMWKNMWISKKNCREL